MPHSVEGVYLLYLRFLRRSVTVGYGDVHSFLQRAAGDASYGDASGVGTEVEGRDEHLRRALKMFRCGYDLHYLVEQVLDVVGGFVVVFRHPAILCRTIYYGEVELVFRSIE